MMKVYELAPEDKLELTNDGDLTLFFLGTGSMFAMAHYQTNLIAVKGNSHVLVDFGMTGPRALADLARVHAGQLNVVLPTHSHEDHIGGLGYLALTNRYIGMPFMKQPKTRLIVTREYKEVLWDYSLRGSLAHNEANPSGGLTLEDYFDIVYADLIIEEPRQIWQANVGDLKLELFRTRHIPEQANTVEDCFFSFGLFIDDRIFYSGDSQFDRELVDYFAGRGAEYFVHDVQFYPGGVHAPLDTLKTLPEELKQRMLLCHYSDNYQEQDISDFAGWARQGVLYNFDK